MLKKEFKYYLDHQEELVKQYNNKYLVIKGGKVIGSYDSKDDAYFETKKTHDLGTFLIQFCSPGNIAYTQTFYSLNVAF